WRHVRGQRTKPGADPEPAHKKGMILARIEAPPQLFDPRDVAERLKQKADRRCHRWNLGRHRPYPRFRMPSGRALVGGPVSYHGARAMREPPSSVCLIRVVNTVRKARQGLALKRPRTRIPMRLYSISDFLRD